MATPLLPDALDLGHIWPNSNGNRATRPAVKHLKSGLCPRGNKGLIEEVARGPKVFRVLREAVRIFR